MNEWLVFSGPEEEFRKFCWSEKDASDALLDAKHRYPHRRWVLFQAVKAIEPQADA